MKLVLPPLSLVRSPVRPLVIACPMDLVIYKLPCVNAAVCEDQLAFTILLAVSVFTVVFGSIVPLFDTLSIRFVVLPLTSVRLTVLIVVNTISIGFIVIKFAFEDVTIGMFKFSLALYNPIVPLSFILGAIEALLFAKAVPFAVLLFAFVVFFGVKGENLAAFGAL